MSEMKDSGIEWIGKIPEHWESTRLKFITKIRKEKDFMPENACYIGLENIKSGYNELIDTETTYDEGKQSICKTGDVLFNKLRPYLNKVFIAPYDAYCTNELLVFSDYLGSKKYLRYLMSSQLFIEKVMSITEGTKMPRADGDEILSFWIVNPPLEEQQQIVSYLDARCSKIDGAIAQRKAIIEKLKEYKSAVITKAVTKGLNLDAEMKDSGFKLIGDIPKHWQITRLKFLMIEGKSKIRVGPFGTQLTNKDLVSSGYWVYTQRTVLDKNFVDNDSFIDKEKFEDLSSFAVYPKDILVTTRGTIGRICIVPPNSPKGVLHPCLIRFRANQDKILYRLLEYIFNESDYFQSQLKYSSNSTIIDVVYSDNLKNIIVPVIPIEEQKIIVSYLDSQCSKIDEAIAKQEQAVAKLEEYRKSIIYYAVTGKIDCRDI